MNCENYSLRPKLYLGRRRARFSPGSSRGMVGEERQREHKAQFTPDVSTVLNVRRHGCRARPALSAVEVSRHGCRARSRQHLPECRRLGTIRLWRFTRRPGFGTKGISACFLSISIAFQVQLGTQKKSVTPRFTQPKWCHCESPPFGHWCQPKGMVVFLSICEFK